MLMFKNNKQIIKQALKRIINEGFSDKIIL